MCWYSASLLFRGAKVAGPSENELWEERIILLSAESEEDARKMAEALGREEDSATSAYRTANGDIVRWRFERIESICTLEDQPGHRSEVFWRFLRASEVESLLRPFDDDE